MQLGARETTRERILEGAKDAVARHGLAKLDMHDVCSSAGVSRGTVYRYFANRDELLRALTLREARGFWARCIDALQSAPEDEERVRLLLRHATTELREHPALRRMLETDPAFVLSATRERFPEIRDELQRLIGPALASSAIVANHVATVEQLVDWMTRLLVSEFLIPSSDPEGALHGLEGVYRLLRVHGDSASS